MFTMYKLSRCGISRTESVVALLLLACLVCLIVPAVHQARESARRRECQNNLRQLAVILQTYQNAKAKYPKGCWGVPLLQPEERWSWYLKVGSYWGHYGTPDINYDRPWNDPSLRPLQLHTWENTEEGSVEYDVPLIPPPVIQCPSAAERTYTDGQPFADYVGTAGIGSNAALLPRDSPAAGMWSYDESTKLADIRDGESNTLVAIETSVDNGCWLACGPATVREYTPNKLALGREGQFGGLHPDGSMAAFVDGHAEFLKDDISHKVFAALLTIAGKEEQSQRP